MKILKVGNRLINLEHFVIANEVIGGQTTIGMVNGDYETFGIDFNTFTQFITNNEAYLEVN